MNTYERIYNLLLEKKSEFKHGKGGMSKDDPRYEKHQKHLAARTQRKAKDWWRRSGAGTPSVADVADSTLRRWMHHKSEMTPKSQRTIRRFRDRYGRLPKVPTT